MAKNGNIRHHAQAQTPDMGNSGERETNSAQPTEAATLIDAIQALGDVFHKQAEQQNTSINLLTEQMLQLQRMQMSINAGHVGRGLSLEQKVQQLAIRQFSFQEMLKAIDDVLTVGAGGAAELNHETIANLIYDAVNGGGA